jgi:hypothetical protein
VLLVVAGIVAYKIDLFRRVGTVLYSYWSAEYRRDYSKDPFFRDPNAAVWVFATHRDLDELGLRYERLFGCRFEKVAELSTGRLAGREMVMERGFVGGGPFNYVSLVEIRWKDRDHSRELLVICGDNSLFGWGYGR